MEISYKEKDFYPFGMVRVVSSLKDIPDGDFGAEYEGSTDIDDLECGAPDMNFYSIVDRGKRIIYAFKN